MDKTDKYLQEWRNPQKKKGITHIKCIIKRLDLHHDNEILTGQDGNVWLMKQQRYKQKYT